MAKVPYPPTLKKSEWQKNKGLITDLAKGSTGIGKALDQVEKGYDEINWDLLDVLKGSRQLKSPTEPETKALMQGINSTLSSINALLALARSTQSEFKASKVVPKAATEYVAELIKGAETLFDKLEKASS